MALRPALAGGFAVAAFCAAPGTTTVLAAQQAGVAAGVAGAIQVSEGERIAAAPVSEGMAMLMRDRLQSEAASRMQVMLLDETVITVGPDSDLVIDEFIYDPTTEIGSLTANFGKGMMRYVSGKLARKNPAAVTIKTGAATIGVRGTALFIMDDPEASDGTSFIGLLGPGAQNEDGLKPSAITVRSGGVAVDVLRAGYGVFVTPGKALSEPVPTPRRLVQAMQQQLTGYTMESSRGAQRQPGGRERPHRQAPGGGKPGKAGNLAGALAGRAGDQKPIGNVNMPRPIVAAKGIAFTMVKQAAKAGQRAADRKMDKFQNQRNAQ